MAFAGRILVVVGAVLLLLAACFFLTALVPSGGWGPMGARFGLIAAAFPGVPGACSFLLGIYLVRRAREQREFHDAMEWNSRSLRGIVTNSTGSPVPRAAVDVFDRAERNQPVATMQTDARGRFSADLPEGQYLLEVGVPEVGESSVEVVISKARECREVQVVLKFDGSAE
jgi:Carboxypeptidase regulatory-like domain